jgi:hypothetical protein
MRTVEIKNNQNWTPLKLQHEFDSMLEFDNRTISTLDGLNINTTFAQQQGIHNTVDNYTNYLLTDAVKINDLIKFKLPVDEYPLQFTTSLLANAFPTTTANSAYLYIVELNHGDPERDHLVGRRLEEQQIGDQIYPATTTQTFTWSQDATENPIYFTITLHDEEFASVNHNDNLNNVFMTTRQHDQYTVSVSFQESLLDIPTDDQKFNYYINEDFGFILFYKQYQDKTFYITPVTDNAGYLKAIEAADFKYDPIPPQSVFKFVKFKKNTTGPMLQNNWISYQTVGDSNSLNTNKTKSYVDVTNNYLLTSQYHNIDNDRMLIDVFQLKNQLTPTGTTNRNNPFPNLLDCDHRRYDRVFVSEHLDESAGLSMGYNNYEHEISLLPDKVTYFNAPQDMYPYVQININDSGLTQSGAIGGDTPINSDKIFKKASGYKYNTPYGAPSDEETGNWLCSWLKSNVGVDWNELTEYRENVIVNHDGLVYRALIDNKGRKPGISAGYWKEIDQPPPVWVDRYYNPEKFSTQKALEFENQYAAYTSKFENIVQDLGAQDEYVFDKISDLTFEPGCLYAYYRIGPEQINVMIESMNENMIHSGVEPAYTQDRQTVLNIQDDMTFTGNEYIQTSTLSNITNSDFTISFRLKRKDWTKPFAGQFLGNYTNEGVGVFNRQDLTQYLIFTNDTHVLIHNTNLDNVFQLDIPDVVSVTKQSGNEDITMYAGTSAISYDMKAMLTEVTVPELTGTNIVHSNIDNDYMYILDDLNNVTRYDISNETRDQLNRAWPYDTVIGSIEHSADLVDFGEDMLWEQSDQTFLQPVEDGKYQFVINCDHYTIDNDQVVWFAKRNHVWRYALSNILGANATWEGELYLPEGGDAIQIQLLANENLRGSEGNGIKLAGDGVSTLYTLINNHNENYPENQVTLVSGNPNVVPDELIELSGGRDRGAASVTHSLSASVSIDGIKSSHDNHLFVMYDRSKVVKMNNLRNILYQVQLNQVDVLLNDATFDECYIDIITEVTKERGFDSYVLILLREPGETQVIHMKLELNDLKLREWIRVDLPGVNLNKQHNITGYETYKQLYSDTIERNHLIFQTRMLSYFDSDKTFVSKLKVNVEDLSPGYHHFVYSFNSNNSNTSLFVDGVLRDTKTSDDRASGAAYKYTTTIQNPLLVGAEPFFNNITFSERLGLDNYAFAKDFSIDRYRLYNEYLNFQKIKMLSREDKEIQPLNLTLPTGKRNFIDHASKFYKHRKPGAKSTDFNISILNPGISASDNQQFVTKELKKRVAEILPVNSSIDSINWIS